MRVLEVFLLTLAGIWQGVRQDFNLLEVALVLAGWLAWKRGWRPNWAWTFSTQRPWLAGLGIAAGAILLRLALLPMHGVPVPIVTDEFSHLLLADTLGQGRLANPTHPFWQHFESLHIIQQPHYVSNYFPGHALFLAAGVWIGTNAWVGVLAECALFLVALFWCLRGFLPVRWAVFGALLAALRFAVASYWVDAYHGGFLPALGGALVLGAGARILRDKPRGLRCLGLGCSLLLVSRPFEGALFCLPVVAMLAWHLRGRVPELLKTSAACAVPVAVAGLGLAIYFTHVTGSPLVTAYQISQKTYGWPMALAWTPPPKVEHRHLEMAAYYRYEVGEHEKVAGPVSFVEFLTFRLQEYWRFFVGPILTLPLLFWPGIWRRRKLVIAALGGTVAAILLEGAASPHYMAPATAAIVLLIVEGCRHMQASRIRVAAAIPVALAGVLAVRLVAQASGLPYTQDLNYQSWCCRVPGNLNKARIAHVLEQAPGDHLVLVKPKTDEYNLLQWIYNAAEIDASRIVWARDLGAEKNAALMSYYSGRQVWMVDPNVEPATLTRVRPGLQATSTSLSK